MFGFSGKPHKTLIERARKFDLATDMPALNRRMRRRELRSAIRETLKLEKKNKMEGKEK